MVRICTQLMNARQMMLPQMMYGGLVSCASQYVEMDLFYYIKISTAVTLYLVLASTRKAVELSMIIVRDGYLLLCTSYKVFQPFNRSYSQLTFFNFTPALWPESPRLQVLLEVAIVSFELSAHDDAFRGVVALPFAVVRAVCVRLASPAVPLAISLIPSSIPPSPVAPTHAGCD